MQLLSATETEKSKAGLRTWQKNNPGALEAASKRGSAIHLGCENYLRGLDPGVPDEYQDFMYGPLLVLKSAMIFTPPISPIKSGQPAYRCSVLQTYATSLSSLRK